MSSVAVIGGGGHVGLPFSLICANAGHKVVAIDTNVELIQKLSLGVYPYIEELGEEYLNSGWDIRFTTSMDDLKFQEVICITLGTPVDAEGNARLDDLLTFLNKDLLASMLDSPHKQLIILRSTVVPGATELIRDKIEKWSKKKEGEDFYLVFAPERVTQGKSIVESTKFPQLIGAFSKKSFDVAENFFFTFIDNKCIFLTPREAEIGKLMTNMYRYVNFALANEFYMIANDQGANINKIIEACNKDYPRMNMAYPGANVSGPCLFKDGKFLLNNIPYADLIQVSFLINEGMPDYLWNQIAHRNPKKIAILGMTFKADNDDTRNSLSFKFRKICRMHDVDTFCFDPYWIHDDNHWYHHSNSILDKMDAIVVMTPHTTLKKWGLGFSYEKIRDDCLIVDMWKCLPSSKDTINGIYEWRDRK